MLDTIGSDSASTEAPSFIEGAITVGSLLAEADVFRIPSFYQRDLSWSAAQAEDLWHDLSKALGAPDEPPVPQLLGQIVLAHIPADRDGSTISDGAMSGISA